MSRFKMHLSESFPRKLFHGTVGDLKLLPKLLYLTSSKRAAKQFGENPILARGRKSTPRLYEIQAQPGKIKNIDDIVLEALVNDEDMEAVINLEAATARKENYRYMEFDHGGEFLVIVSLYPDKDLKIKELD
jgi:hypothetical protein